MGSMLMFAYALLAGRRPIIMTGAYLAFVVTLSPGSWPYYEAFLAGDHMAPRTPSKRKAWQHFAIVAGVMLRASTMILRSGRLPAGYRMTRCV